MLIKHKKAVQSRVDKPTPPHKKDISKIINEVNNNYETRKLIEESKSLKLTDPLSANTFTSTSNTPSNIIRVMNPVGIPSTPIENPIISSSNETSANTNPKNPTPKNPPKTPPINPPFIIHPHLPSFEKKINKQADINEYRDIRNNPEDSKLIVRKEKIYEKPVIKSRDDFYNKDNSLRQRGNFICNLILILTVIRFE